MKKLKKIFQSPKAKKVVAVAMAICCLALNAVTCFAAEPTSDIAAATEGVTTIFTDISSVFSFTNIITFIGIAIGAAAVLTLAWFGLRKVISMIQKALKGKGVRV